MEIGSHDRLNTIMLSLNDWTEELQLQGYPTAARLLAMASLDLRMKRHNISDNEFHALCSALEIKPVATAGELKPSFPRRELQPTGAAGTRVYDRSQGMAQHHQGSAARLSREPDVR